MFSKRSRYHSVPDRQLEDDRGRVVRYKAIRLIPDTPVGLTHRVRQGERLDHIAFAYLTDPERFWRIADANLMIYSEDLRLEPGSDLGIPEREG